MIKRKLKFRKIYLPIIQSRVNETNERVSLSVIKFRFVRII